MASLKLACVVLMCMAVVGAPIAQAIITCGQVSSNLVPCIPYLQRGGTVAPGCCTGVKNLLAVTKTAADRRAACNCMKSAAGSVAGFNPKFAESLPAQCKVSIPYKISTSTNCASIKF